MVLPHASTVKSSGAFPFPPADMVPSPLFDDSSGCALDHHPDHHHRRFGGFRIFPLPENGLPFAFSAQATKVSFSMGKIDVGSLGDGTV